MIDPYDPIQMLNISISLEYAKRCKEERLVTPYIETMVS